MVYDFDKRATKEGNAISLWNIEMKIRAVHQELELLHEAKDQLLSDKDRRVAEWETDWHDHYP